VPACLLLFRYAVSELLPESGNAQPAPAAAGKGARGAAGKPAAPLVPQGKAKAEALIAAGATMHSAQYPYNGSRPTSAVQPA